MSFEKNDNLAEDNELYNKKTFLEFNMKKSAILSIAIPIVTIVLHWLVGFSVLAIIILAVAGLYFAKECKEYYKKISNIGYFLNYLLIVFSVVMIFVFLFESF